MRLTQARDGTPGELGARATKLSALGFSEKVKENAAIQGNLVGLFIGGLENERIRHDLIREASVRLSVAKDNEKVWNKNRIGEVLVGNQGCSRQSKMKKTSALEKMRARPNN